MDKAILISKYKSGSLNSSEEELLEQLITNGEVSMSELELEDLHKKVVDLTTKPTDKLNDRFYSMLADEKKKQKRWSIPDLTGIWSRPYFRYAYSFLLLFIGIMVGNQFISTNKYDNEVKQLSNEVSEMKEMMMLQLLEQESTTDRLRAVSLTEELPEVSGKVTTALLQTLNSDDNTNVRLAALEALLPYAGKPIVREGLIEAISKQNSPLVQVALAEVMVALQEKKSVDKLEQIIDSDSTPSDVKERIRENLKVLI